MSTRSLSRPPTDCKSELSISLKSSLACFSFTFYGFNANRAYQTLGYYLFNMVQEGRVPGSALQQLYRRASALGLMLTAIIAPLTILIRNLMLKFGPNEN